MSDGISAHGTIVARADQATPTVFEDIAELGDITPPSLGRNEIETTTQNDDIDAYVLGVLRRGQMTFPLNFLPNIASHDHLTGLYASVIGHQTDGWQVTFPTAVSTVWVFSGGISNIVPAAPVDGALRANVTIRPTGKMTINGVVVGNL